MLNCWKKGKIVPNFGTSKDGPIVEDIALGIHPNSVYAPYTCT